MTHLAIYETKRTLRRDRAAWQRAALGLLVLSVAVNGVLYGLYLHQERQAERWRQECLEMEAARDAALSDGGKLKVQEREAQFAREPDSGMVYEEIVYNASMLTRSQVEDNASRYAPITSEERELLARLVWLEARGEPAEGQQAVAEVVLNRVAADNFPDSVAAVINQNNQFSSATQIPGAEPTDVQYQAVDAALYGEPVLPPDVVYFSQQGENGNVWDKIGGHVFCYQYDWEAGNG